MDPAFHQPLVTYPEVQLIIAEAAFRTGDQVTARTSLNAERATVPLPAVPVTVVDSALMDSIMVEKYVVMFQTIESWNDVKRECRPALVPTSAVAGGHVISRPFYGVTEESANPNALPDPVSGRNWNDPRSSVTPVDPCP